MVFKRLTVPEVIFKDILFFGINVGGILLRYTQLLELPIFLLHYLQKQQIPESFPEWFPELGSSGCRQLTSIESRLHFCAFFQKSHQNLCYEEGLGLAVIGIA